MGLRVTAQHGSSFSFTPGTRAAPTKHRASELTDEDIKALTGLLWHLAVSRR